MLWVESAYHFEPELVELVVGHRGVEVDDPAAALAVRHVLPHRGDARLEEGVVAAPLQAAHGADPVEEPAQRRAKVRKPLKETPKKRGQEATGS